MHSWFLWSYGAVQDKGFLKQATEKTWGRIGAICCISLSLPKLSLGAEGRETTIKIVGEKIRLEVKGGAQDTVQHPAKNKGRVGEIQREETRSQRDKCTFYEKWRRDEKLHLYSAVPVTQASGNVRFRVGQLTHRKKKPPTLLRRTFQTKITLQLQPPVSSDP